MQHPIVRLFKRIRLVNIRIYCLLLLLFVPLIASTQKYIQSTYHYNLEKGLETRNIRSTFKDSQGFMWIATDIGAYRFDGFEFHPYKRNIQHNVPLSVERISEDADGNLWFCHFNYSAGISDFSILLKGDNELVPIEDYFKDDLPFPVKDCFNNVPRTNNHKGIWLASRKSKEIYEYIDGSFKKVGVLPEFKKAGVLEKHTYFAIDKDSNGTNWLAYNGYLYQSDLIKGFERYEKLPFDALQFRIDDSDRFWFTKGKEIFIKETKDTPLITPKFVENLDLGKIIEFRIESINNRYIVANQGNIGQLLLIDYTCNNVTPIKNPEIQSDVSITPSHVHVDQTNTVWISTYEGVFQIGFQKNPFKKHLKGKSTRGIIQKEDGNIFVASYSGWFELETKSGNEKLITNKIVHGQSAYIDTKNNFWVGGPIREFCKIGSFDPLDVKFYKINREEGTVFKFYEHNHDDRLWIGGEFGLGLYDEKKDKFSKHDQLNKFTEINTSSVYDFESIDETNFFAAASNGLYQIDIHKGIVEHFCSSNNNFPYNFITYIYRDKEDHTFWLGTKLGGLIHWDFPNGEPVQITTQNELTDNTIYAIYEDKINLGYLWLPSNNGLMHYNKKTGEVTNYKVEDGIVHDEFNFQSHFENKDSIIYFGGIQGITSFHPKDIVISGQRPKLHLVDLEYLDNDSMYAISNLESYSSTNPITLKPSTKSINITVALNDYTKANESKYYSKIEGVDNNWVAMEGNSIFLNTLPSGNHQLSIKAKNAKGIWAENQINIPFKMLPPIYLRWWFLVLMAFLLFGLVKAFIKRRTYKLEKDKENLELEVARRTTQIETDKQLIEKQAEELQELDKIKSRFFSNVTHELRTPLTLILGPLQQLLKSGQINSPKVRKTLESIAQNSVALRQLVEEILDLNRLDARKITLNKEPVRLRNVVEKWINNFNPEAENRNINFTLDYNASTNLYLNVDVQKLERIVINLLANAFKYSESEDTIYLRIHEKDNEMQILVEDTGLGIHEDDLPHIFQRFYQTKQAENNLMGGLGIGLALSKELSALMKGEITVESELKKGSTFKFRFPKEIVEGEMVPYAKEPKMIITEAAVKKVGNTKRKNILVVEDNLGMQSYVIELLDTIANVHKANNGKVALAMLQDEKSNYDIIISDVMMPEMDGFTFLEKARAMNVWKLTPFIFLTARADIQDKIKALRIGVDDYIVKPFEAEELRARVNNLLSKIISREKEDLKKEETPQKAYEIINKFEGTDSADLKWLKEIEQIAIKNIEAANFNVVQFAFKVHLGERQLGRKLKKLTGMTPGNYLKEVRLQKARHLLENRTFSTVSEVAFHVGFSTPEYFSKIFKKRFGKLPTNYFRNFQDK